jgi:hypothetical protein
MRVAVAVGETRWAGDSGEGICGAQVSRLEVIPPALRPRRSYHGPKAIARLGRLNVSSIRQPSPRETPAHARADLLAHPSHLRLRRDKMAAALTAEQIEAGLEGLDADLAWVLEDTGVERSLRGLIGHLKIRRLATFAKFESSEDKFRDAAKGLLGLDPAEDPENRVRMALLVDAWDRARDRLKAQSAVEAEASAEGRVKPMPRGSQISLRKKYEAALGEVHDSVYPAKDYLLDILEMLEESEFVAESLTQVVSWEQSSGKSSEDVPVITVGTVRVRGSSKKQTTPAPRNTDELRKVYRVLWTAWTVVRLKHPDRVELKGIGREPFEEVLDYLLGPRCWDKLTVSGTRIPWTALMEYEHQIRKHAARYVNRGKGTLVDGLRDAVRDAELRNEYFVEPLAMSKNRRSRSPRREPPPRENKPQKGPKGKGGKAKGKGYDGVEHGKGDRAAGSSSDALSAEQISARAAVNKAKKLEKLKWYIEAGGTRKSVCIRFNRLDRCDDKCRFLHVCLRCGGNHTIGNCPVAPVLK